ncbi:MAG: 50S ribosomal protein L9 [Deltaproteobacteria bacterium]|nr:50S ribosomal protein L9 [Deltaproteobacteria bacterium]
MEVILREEVPHLGVTGDVVKVKPGYARNYLLPRGLAIVADRRNVKALEHLKRVAGEKREREKRAAESVAQKITALRLVIKARAGEEGKLFGSVTNQDIEKALAAAGHAIERKRVRLTEPIKTLGEHSVAIHLAPGVDPHATIIVEPEE